MIESNSFANRSVKGKRILFVCSTSSPIGGLQTWLDEISVGLERRGWEPIVALVNGPSTHDSAGYKAAHPDLHTVTIDGSAMTMAARVRQVMRTVRRLQPDFYLPLTVIDAHDAICALKMKDQYRGRYVLSLHGNLPQQIADATLFQPFADVSINPGALTCRLVEWAGMPRSHVFHAPNGTSLHDCRKQSDPQQPIRLAYVGRLTDEDKRVMDLVGVVDALEAMSLDYQLDVVGSGPCEERLRSLITSDSVTFHGFIEAERLHRDLYPSVDILLMFSESEAFGISLIEAMAHGVVPVSSRFVGSGAEGFLMNGQTGELFDIGHTAGCAEVVARLARDRDVLAELSMRAHEFVTTRYSWSQCLHDWESALMASLELPRRPVPKAAPRKLDEGNSLARRWPWMPPRLSDVFYRTKHRLLGIPQSMLNGEEWPIHTPCFEKSELALIQTQAKKMDRELESPSTRI